LQGLGIIKISLSSASLGWAPALLPVLARAAKSAGSFQQSTKTVCFWQRLKHLKTEKTFGDKELTDSIEVIS
jgi:hypothetical protein